MKDRYRYKTIVGWSIIIIIFSLVFIVAPIIAFVEWWQFALFYGIIIAAAGLTFAIIAAINLITD